MAPDLIADPERRALNWLAGGCYGSYEDLRTVHMKHHVDNADVGLLDYRGYLTRHPVQLKIVEALEWLYVPVVEFVMHGERLKGKFALIRMKPRGKG